MSEEQSANEAKPKKKKRAVVLGAGPAGLSAALGLIESGEYDVDVYQMGWRAGGKCATGRDAGHLRARQNGSHYLFGCYYNAFALIRRAHEILAASTNADDRALYGSFFGDFVARNLLVGAAGEHRVARSPRLDRGLWLRYLPQNMACPGADGKFCTPFDYFTTVVQLGLGTLIDIYSAIVIRESEEEPFEGVRLFVRLFPISPFETSDYSRRLRAVLGPVRVVFNLLAGLVTGALKALLLLWVVFMPIPVTRAVVSLMRTVSLLTVAGLRELGRGVSEAALKENHNASNAGQRLMILFELALAGITGFWVDELWRPGAFEKLDNEDFRAWLHRHGASPLARQSSLVRTWYDATISYEDGEEQRASASAGVALQAVLRSMLTYKGAFAFQMGAEVGDSFVAPIVRALEVAGVKFHFYQRVRRILVSSDTHHVERIELVQQVEHVPTQAEFMPIEYEVDGRTYRRHAWPSVAPRSAAPGCSFPLDSYYSQAAHSQHALTRAADDDAGADRFHVVVCALPLGVIEDVLEDTSAGPLRDAPGPWREMFQQVRSTESQAIRMWFNVPIRALGWRHEPPILSGATWPHSTWEDNSQAIDIQNFPPHQQPKTIATLFGPLATGRSNIRTPQHHDAQVAVARKNARDFLEAAMPELWPEMRCTDHSPAQVKLDWRKGVDWTKFIDLDDGEGEARFDFQLVSANVGPNESYVLAWPGTLRYRMRPDESGYRNLFLAGDWTRNGIEAGTVEGAVMSGIKAARAITGQDIPLVGADDFDRGSVLA